MERVLYGDSRRSLSRVWQFREKKEQAGLWVDSNLAEVTPLRGSGFINASIGGPAALALHNTRSNGNYYVSLRSALLLENWELVTDALAGA